MYDLICILLGRGASSNSVDDAIVVRPVNNLHFRLLRTNSVSCS